MTDPRPHAKERECCKEGQANAIRPVIGLLRALRHKNLLPNRLKRGELAGGKLTRLVKGEKEVPGPWDGNAPSARELDARKAGILETRTEKNSLGLE